MTIVDRIAARSDPVDPPKRRVPGELGLWVFLGGDLAQFLAFFAYFGYQHARHIDEFETARDTLSMGQGVLNTLLLLASSVFVAMGVATFRGVPTRLTAGNSFVIAWVLGLGFVLSKCVEYGIKFGHGSTITSNDFFMYYFAFTGIHLAHVLCGLVFLTIAWRRVQRTAAPADEHSLRSVESIALFWHMVDLIWVVLFPILYLI